MLLGLLVSAMGAGAIKRNWARLTGASLSELHVRRIEERNLAVRLSQAFLPALDDDGGIAASTVATGSLAAIIRRVVDRAGHGHLPKGNRPDKGVANATRGGVDVGDADSSTRSKAIPASARTKSRPCLVCGQPVSGRAPQARYCMKHSTRAARKRHIAHKVRSGSSAESR